MKNISDRIRLALREKNMNQSALAKKVGVTPQAVGKWFKTNSISKENLTTIAKALDVSVDWLLNGNAQLLDKSNNTRPINIITNNNVPLISWVQAGAWEAVHSEHHAEQYYPCPEKHSASTFALKVCGESMSPDFIDGEIIYVDPEVEPKNGSCVVVQQNGNTEATFKQLVFDGSKRYLKALNPNWPNPIIEMLEDATICGVVIGSYRKRS